MRPIFSPTDFVQMKGRGTRGFRFECKDGEKKGLVIKKERFYLFDFFANCEYFEEKFDYDKVLKLPKSTDKTGDGDDTAGTNSAKIIMLHEDDPLKSLKETIVGQEGMKIDRQLFQQARQLIVTDAEIKNAVEQRQWDDAIRVMQDKYEDKPNLYLTLEKIRRSEGLDRRITWREVLERIFGMTQIDRFMTKVEKLEADIHQFVERHSPESNLIPLIHDFMSLYLTDERFRSIINHETFSELHTYSGFSTGDLKQLGGSYREIILEYIKTNISLNSYLD
jgi:type I restriction enzyme, R subunit